MVGVLNDGCLALLCSIGHQVGLFDTMAKSGPATSAQIARAAGLHERYVREWLGGMTTAASSPTIRRQPPTGCPPSTPPADQGGRT